MGRKIKRLNYWIRRRSYIPLILLGGLMATVLFLNEDTSVALSMEYEREIYSLQEQIRQERDSAAWYRAQREALLTGTVELEHIAREQYHMQRPTEDVFVLK